MNSFHNELFRFYAVFVPLFIKKQNQLSAPPTAYGFFVNKRPPEPAALEDLLFTKLVYMKKLVQFFFFQYRPDKERTEFAVSGAHFIKAHFIDQFFKLQNIIGK